MSIVDYTPPAAATPRVTIGDIVVEHGQALTPIGTIPLASATWRLTEQAATTRVTPTWAVVLAIALIPCTGFLSLLFLLAKETRTEGWTVIVELSHPLGTHTTHWVARDLAALGWARQAVTWARAQSLAASRRELPGGE